MLTRTRASAVFLALTAVGVLGGNASPVAAATANVTFVAPYVGTENQPGTLVIRGVNFTVAGATVTAVIGTTEIGPLTPDSATQVTVNYPGMPAGTYPVTLENESGLLATNAELVVLAPLALTYQAISVSSVRERLAYDAERQTLYGVNQTDQLIESYTLSGGSWVAVSPYALPNIMDLALWPNGRALVALARNGVYEIPLASGAFAAQLRAPYSLTFCGQHLDRLAVANDGKAFVISKLSGCSGVTQSYLYDVVNYSLVALSPLTYLENGNVGGGADGSKLVLGQNDLSTKVMFYQADTRTVTETSTSGFALNAISVSGNASRVILDQTSVLDGSITRLGNLPPAPRIGVALAARDSARAYYYRDDATGGGPRLEVYDLNGALQAGSLYPLLKTVPLADSPNTAAGNYAAIALAETPDGNTVFISGNSKILIVPVN